MVRHELWASGEQLLRPRGRASLAWPAAVVSSPYIFEDGASSSLSPATSQAVRQG